MEKKLEIGRLIYEAEKVWVEDIGWRGNYILVEKKANSPLGIETNHAIPVVDFREK